MRAISSMATRQLLADLSRAANFAGLPELQIESVGGVEAADRVASGESFDLVFLAQGALQALASAGHVDGKTLTPLVRSQVAIAVPSGNDEPAVSPNAAAFVDAARLRDALRGADRIGYSTGPSGTALVRMIERWGMADELDGRLLQARPGIPVAKSLAEGDVQIGFQQLSELISQRGIRILGTMPADAAIDTVFAGVVAAASTTPTEADEMLKYLASPAAVSIKLRHAFQIV